MGSIGRPAEPVPQDSADSIIEWISEGNTLRAWCRQPNTPSFRTVYNWLEKDKDFSSRFAMARDMGYDCIAQECLDIADNMHEGIKTKETNNGIETFREDALGHRKLQIDTRLRLLAKWNPKKYGDRAGEEETRDIPPINITLTHASDSASE